MRGYIEEGSARVRGWSSAAREMPDGLDTGWYVRPTLFSDADNDMRIAREEIFGPVLTVIPYDDEDDAVRIANDSDYGLAGSVFTPDTPSAGSASRAGCARVPSASTRATSWTRVAPFGGVKQSGYGRELGREGLESYLVSQSVSSARPRSK